MDAIRGGITRAFSPSRARQAPEADVLAIPGYKLGDQRTSLAVQLTGEVVLSTLICKILQPQQALGQNQRVALVRSFALPQFAAQLHGFPVFGEGRIRL